MESADYHIGRVIKEYMKKQGRTEICIVIPVISTERLRGRR